MTFSVLFVCTGNICRSPLAERLFVARIDPSAPVQPSSAGTSALVGRGIDPPSATVLRELGGVPDGHVARRLTTKLSAGADLILTAESTHRSIVVTADPLTYRRCFTMREFGRLGATLEPTDQRPMTAEALRDRVAQVAGQRGRSDCAVAEGQDDIGDPFRASADVVRLRAEEVAQAVDAVIDVLGLAPAGSRR